MRLSAFGGVWEIERTITNHLDGSLSRFSGTADFGTGPDLGRYREEGRLELDGGTVLVATRSYRWTDATNRIDIFFDHGGYFHGFGHAEVTPLAEHLCGDDLYRVGYDFQAWPVWTATWRVEGPAKDYLMTSTYRRTGQDIAIQA
ncbi:DUF6314 family protein [Amaricoccus tamworthensis]|uniref:DUF6314 family protein n=1 Tax=Amaricoccus tamworthensis TaxID=57002 RepID=UPI003C7E05D0